MTDDETKALTLGQQVTVNENYVYHGEYAGEVWTVVGLALKAGGHVDVTIARDTVDGQWDATDGFSVNELDKVAE